MNGQDLENKPENLTAARLWKRITTRATTRSLMPRAGF